MDETIPIQRPQKVKSIFDLVVKKGLIDIRRAIEHDWMIEVNFLHRITGIDLSFSEKYMTRNKDFELINVSDISSGNARISLHINNIYEKGELEEKGTCKYYLQVQKEGTREVQLLTNIILIIS